MRLNRNKDFGKINGEFVICGMQATYEQDGRFFDQFDEEIVEPGSKKQVVATVKKEADRSQPKPPSEPTETDAERHARIKTQAEVNMGESLSARDLLEQCDVLPWGAFHKEAKRILGPKCPGGKDAIIGALKKAMVAAPERAARRSAQAGASKPEGAAPTPPPAQASPGAVDLAQWGMGKKEYLWPQVRSAIRAQFSVVVEKRRDAVHLLVEEKVIPGALARSDFETSDK